MAPEARRAVATFLAEHAARRHGVREFPMALPAPSWLILCAVAAPCTPIPNLLTVVDRAIVAELTKLPNR